MTSLPANPPNMQRLLKTGTWEGISFLVLLFIAMPLKYLADLPKAVTIVGSLHGVLFLLFIAMIYICYESNLITFRKALLAFVLSLLPFGTFFLKRTMQGDPGNLQNQK